MGKADNNNDKKQKALDFAMSQIEKQHGKGAIMKLGDRKHLVLDVIPTGSLTLDAALGIGGIPKGRVCEIFGMESGGKTTLALHIIAESQKQGGMAAFIDAEHALDSEYARNIGVDVDNLIISQPDFGEQALDIAETLARSGAVDIIVIDSVAALVPKSEIDGEMGDSHMGLQARLMSQAMRKLVSVVNKSNCAVVFINQIRMKIGVMFGNPETTTGGFALKFYSSVRIDIRKISAIKVGDASEGIRVRAKVIKNKVAAPFKRAEFDILFGKGISKYGEIIDLAVENEFIEKAGSWYSYNNQRIGQGRNNVIDFLKENETISKELEGKIREKFDIKINKK